MPPPALLPPRRYRAVLRHTIPLTETTRHFEWEVVEGGRFDFAAGQFISLTLARDAGEITRAYSIASPPRGDTRFDLCLNRVPGGVMSNHLCDLQPGAKLDFTGPHGFFIVPPPIEHDLVFIATGTGIAPVRGMIADLFARGLEPGCEVWLLFGVRYPETILYRAEFERLAAERPNFHFVPTLSRPPADWPGARGYVQQQLRERFAGRQDFTACICGLKAMVDEVRRILKAEFGFDRRLIKFEKYD